jgi:hypothetical protein
VNGLFRIILALANPCQSYPSHFHEDLANRLKKLILVGCVNERVIALIKGLKRPVQPA